MIKLFAAITLLPGTGQNFTEALAIPAIGTSERVAFIDAGLNYSVLTSFAEAAT